MNNDIIFNELMPLIDTEEFRKNKRFIQDKSIIVQTLDIRVSNSYKWQSWYKFLKFDINRKDEALFYIVGFDKITTDPDDTSYEIIHSFSLNYTGTLLVNSKTGEYLHDIFPEFITLSDNRKLSEAAIISLLNKLDICPINKIVELPKRLIDIMDYYDYFSNNYSVDELKWLHTLTKNEVFLPKLIKEIFIF